MAVDVDQLVRELRGFNRRRELTQAITKGIRKPVPAVRKAIRKAAIGTLPAGGGLNKWVAKSRINVTVKLSGRNATIKLVGGRNSESGRSDLAAIDRGRLRHPSWGRRGPGQWHTQAVTPGFFTKTAAEQGQWISAVEAEVDSALDQIRRG